eukprot:4606835-Pyramimonas_sp.AAC.1
MGVLQVHVRVLRAIYKHTRYWSAWHDAQGDLFSITLFCGRRTGTLVRVPARTLWDARRKESRRAEEGTAWQLRG